MSDVTIPSETAKRIAGVLRMHADTVPTGSAAATQWGALADLLDPGEQPKPVCQWGECALVAEKRAVAALLRAVADDIEDWRDRLEHWPEPITLGPPTRAWDAALALADTILESHR